MSRSGAASTWPYRLRRLHLYLGALFAPALLFFAFSGALQEFGLQDAGQDGYRPAAWIEQLAAVHKHQTLKLPVVAAKRKSVDGGAIKVAPPTPVRTTILRVFFCAASVGLIVSTLIGLYLALKFSRRPRVILALAGAGVVIPLLLLLA
ncbi:MAG TPA: hypothetical protein VGH03_06765 [Caulobacteraceae bacterium]|jgi:hypothetical protein